MSHPALFDLFVPGAPQRFRVLSFTGREQIGKSYAFDIELAGPLVDAGSIERLYVGRPAHLRFGAEGDGERWVHGVIRRLEAEGRVADREDRYGYRLRLVPALRLLGYQRQSRIFQDQSIPEIVRTLLVAAGVAVELRLSRTYRPRDYCVQHQEADLHFVERILAEEGIFKFFEHPAREDAAEILVLADETSACKPIAGDAVMRVEGADGMRAADDRDLQRFRLRRRIEPGSVLLKDFDFLRPSFDLRGGAGAEPPKGRLDPNALEQYHHHGELEPAGVGDASARTRLEQHRRKLWVGVGESRCPRLLPGHTLIIQEAMIDGHPGSYTLFEVEHKGRASGPGGAGTAPETTYSNRFRAVPERTPFRPRAPQPRVQQILETATVVGAPGEEIHTDALGRIKVRFHWDRSGTRDDHTSCWMRVMQPWAGTGWGFQFIPRVGMEVVVCFLAGDTDRPMVLGSVYNQANLPPFQLPANKTRSGIRTRSSKSAEGYNEISFDDKAGDETLVVRAQKYLTETVGGDRTTSVGHDATFAVAGQYVSSVGGDASSTVSGNLLDHVSANRAASTGGSVAVNIAGNHDERVLGHRSLNVHGVSVQKIHGAATTTVEGHASVAALGALTVTIGAAQASAGMMHGHGPLFVGSDKGVVVTAVESIALQCGDSFLRLTPDHIEISAKTVLVKGVDKTVVRGDQALLELAAEARLAGPATRLFGKSASVEASTDAFMKGTKVKLGTCESDPPTASDETATPETRTLKLKLSDGGFFAYASRPYELTVEGVRYTGTTGGDGSVAVDIPASATTASVLVWEGDPPTGKSHTWSLVIAEPPAASTLEGARSRLANLGYAVGNGSALDPITERALTDFQLDHDLEPSGELDGPTASKLAEIHGH